MSVLPFVAWSAASTLNILSCNATDKNQAFAYNEQTGHIEQSGQCWRSGKPSSSAEAGLTLEPCGSDATFKFIYNATSHQLTSLGSSDMCLDDDFGAKLYLYTCHKLPLQPDDPQYWEYENSHFIRPNATWLQQRLCVSSSQPPKRVFGPGCSDPKLRNSVLCDPSQSMEARVDDYVKRLSLIEKLGGLSNNANAMPSVGNTGGYQWWNEALHGVAIGCQSFNGTQVCPTSFPQVLTTAASFNKTLFNLIGAAVGREGRAFHNIHSDGRNNYEYGLTVWAPNINIFRSPLWGRGHETPGEDPTLNADYAAAFVSGVQGSRSTLQLSACCKHYDAYSLENWNGMDRHHFNAKVSDQDFADTYFVPFVSCANRGNASGVMCSYNEVNGVPSCANKELLTTQLRGNWGFDGYITSDCGAVSDVISTHNFTHNDTSTVADVLQAGMDNDCGGFFGKNLQAAYETNAINDDDVDAAIGRLAKIQLRLGMFDPPAKNPYSQLDQHDISTPEHQQLALEAALQGMVLLKQGRLPLDSKTHSLSMAVIGPNADDPSVLQGNYAGGAPYLITPLAGLAKYASTVYTQGCNLYSNDTSGFKEAIEFATLADVTVLVVGNSAQKENPYRESEEADRYTLKFPGQQEALIEAVANVSRQLILVVIAGGAIDLTNAKEQASSIIWSGYAGQSTGDAIAMTIFGDFSPTGRLPQTLYKESYLQEASHLNMNMRPDASTGYPGRTHRFYNGSVVYPFGYGLSYTTFERSLSWSMGMPTYQELATMINESRYTPETAPVLGRFTIGTRASFGGVPATDTVIVFITNVDAPVRGAPLQEVFAYEKLVVPDMNGATVQIPLRASHLRLATQDGSFVPMQGKVVFKTNDDGATTFLTLPTAP